MQWGVTAVIISSSLSRLGDNSEYLFQVKDDEEFQYWMEHLSDAIDGSSDAGSKEPKRAHTLPADSTSPGGKKAKGKGLFTLKRKWEPSPRGGHIWRVCPSPATLVYRSCTSRKMLKYYYSYYTLID